MVKDSEQPQSDFTKTKLLENGDMMKDCHSIVKSSGLNGPKRRRCCEHRLMKGGSRASVSCQTDDGGLWSSSPEATSSSSPSPANQSGGSPKKEDGSKSDGTLRLMIQNFRSMNDTVRGPGKAVSGVPWKIMVMPRQHVVAKKGTQKCLGFFLQCCPNSYSDSWSCQASAELRLISQKPGVPNFVRKTNHLYTAKENDWGYSCFMTWADILEEAQGYMKDEKVILEVFVKAEPPKGILSHNSFCKKIEDYMRLAEMQSSRGLIDKAIEVNQTALKFCKDKDEEMKTDLEKQRHKLIEMKLKQSIERIEKGHSGSGDNADDPANNLNTLRQALTGNWSALKKSQAAAAVAKGNERKGTDTEQVNGEAIVEITAEDDDDGSLDELAPLLMEGGQKQQSLKESESREDDEWEEGGSEEASCSEDEDAESGFSDELCDTCLQDRLETISGEEVTRSDSTTQTEPASPPSKVRLPPVGAPASPDFKNNNAVDIVKESGNTGGKRAMSTSPSLEDNASSKWTPEREAELLDLITQESRASLDTIRDTLERLVALAKDGEVPPGLDLDLAALRAETQDRGFINADIVEIPPIQPVKEPSKTPPVSHQPALMKSASTPLYTEDEYSLIRHAKEIVETKAEELVSKYSQLIEQSEATRLAETVKKVEKRMKDIEKQTMTCRKELADECERHYREEQKLIKSNKQLRVQLDQASEKMEKLNTQIKEKKAEIKKLEKKLKAESQISAENADLVGRIEQLEKELAVYQKKANEENKRVQKETQQWLETKKLLQRDLSGASGEMERLNAQVEEKERALKAMEERVDKEAKDKRLAQNALRDAVERAKKAEMNLLEFKLEMGIKLLQRAQDDCQSNIKHLGELIKRCKSTNSEEYKALSNYMLEWQRTRDRIGEIINRAKSDFGGQIDAVKAGKPLGSLPVLDVPKPPPPPQAPKIAPPIQQPPTEPPRQPLAPIGARPGVAGVTEPLTNGTASLGLDTSGAFGSPEMRTPPLGPAPSAENGPLSLSNGFSPWSDPLSSLTESLFSRSIGSMGALGEPAGGYGLRAAPAPFSSAAPIPGPFQTAGQWGVGWGYQQVTTAPTQSPVPVSSADKSLAGIRPLSRGSPNAQGLGDSRGSSPITAQNERHKRVDALMEQLRATFPNSNSDSLRDCVNEFRSQQPGKTLKGLSVETALNGVVTHIMNKNRMGWKLDDASAGVSMTLDTFSGVVSVSPDSCPICSESLQGYKTTTLKCRHRFHNKCVKDWLSSQQTCPACGKFNPNPEEYPELS